MQTQMQMWMQMQTNETWSSRNSCQSQKWELNFKDDENARFDE